MKRIQVTRMQYDQMDRRISELDAQLRAALAERDKAKSADGDRSENSALDAAEREVAAIQMQLDEARREYRIATVVDTIDTSRVGILTQVKLKDADGNERWVSIVDAGQGRPKSYVSIDSKMGAALRGHRVGETVSFQDNRYRTRVFKILEIREDQ